MVNWTHFKNVTHSNLSHLINLMHSLTLPTAVFLQPMMQPRRDRPIAPFRRLLLWRSQSVFECIHVLSCMLIGPHTLSPLLHLLIGAHRHQLLIQSISLPSERRSPCIMRPLSFKVLLLTLIFPESNLYDIVLRLICGTLYSRDARVSSHTHALQCVFSSSVHLIERHVALHFISSLLTCITTSMPLSHSAHISTPFPHDLSQTFTHPSHFPFQSRYGNTLLL
mmetsp:Transcript_9799/g.36559  ORF Transcript_9799/g.36559 Transcript_9799/m.36559 type:complete len:223 (-) Transcript_9799:226-894(-)